MPSRRDVSLESRITVEAAAQIEALSKLWGAVKPLSRADVVIEAVRRAWEAETRSRERR